MVGFAHDPRGAHDSARIWRHDLPRLAKVLLGQIDNEGASLADRRMRQNLARIGRGDAVGSQCFARQIKTAEGGILVEVAQNVGELERQPQMVRELKPRVMRHAEHAHRETSDRTRDAVAVKVERRAVGGTDVGDHVHLHAVDDGEEVLALQIESAHGSRQTGERRRCRAAIDRVDVGPPARQLLAPFLARPRVVGDVVDGAAERIDFEHRLALRARQDAHAGIERAAGGALGSRSGLPHSRTPRLLRRGGGAPAQAPGRPAQDADHRAADDGGYGQMHAIA